MSQMVMDRPAMQETLAESLDQEDPMEKGMDIYANIFAWRIPWTEMPSRLQSMVSQNDGCD